MARIEAQAAERFGLQYDTRSNRTKKDLYREAINQCCDPECEYGYGLQVHHMLPLSQGGLDTFDNYIVLCRKCHRAHQNHKAEEVRLVELKVYKLYAEKLLLGVCSEGIPDDQFRAILKGKRKKWKMPHDSPGCPTIEDRSVVDLGLRRDNILAQGKCQAPYSGQR